MASDPDLRGELQAEYLLLQSQYEAYDQRALSLKGLATPLLGAGVAFGLKDPSLPLVAVTVALAIALWVLEVTWKVFQYCNIPRIQKLEAWFASADPDEMRPFQVYGSWAHAFKGEWGGVGRWLAVAIEPFVCLPYIVVVVAGASAALILANGKA
ncbi:MAG TPA: hypothetical protein VN694_15600 [Caulobacteraceae bacterium]|nr:hypothetical protein [Caulobacteraceae bacterium]